MKATAEFGLADASSLAAWNLLLQNATTLAMTGIIWFVQIVHYPLFASVGRDGFAAYEAQHADRTGWVVGPLMCAELAGALLLLSSRMRPAGISMREAVWGVALVAMIWLSTFLVQVPLHQQLHAGYDAAAVQRLVTTNWVRTAAWSTRALLVLRMVWQVWWQRTT